MAIDISKENVDRYYILSGSNGILLGELKANQVLTHNYSTSSLYYEYEIFKNEYIDNGYDILDDNYIQLSQSYYNIYDNSNIENIRVSKTNELSTKYNSYINTGITYSGSKYLLDEETKQNIADWELVLQKARTLGIESSLEIKMTNTNNQQMLISQSDWDMFFIKFASKLSKGKSYYKLMENNILNATSSQYINDLNIDFNGIS